ncbi:MAG TPA: serine hydrolase domain-containing protein [Acidimicrobiales bacterium]|nr:serine hydrolase domain-containing protein [Acidimicrobiales bacterium]
MSSPVGGRAAVDGTTAPGFEAVRDAFADNLESGRDVGAAFAAYHHGRKVVDLWGGIADPATGRPWEEDSIVLVFSTTKGATALCANMLAERGMLDVNAPVVRYWPEFAQGGKAEIPVKYLLSHQAGLAWIDGEMSLEEALSWEPVVSALARQEPHWEPGERHGYHATTYGWLVGEVIRRITGTSVGTFFRTEIAEPLRLDFWIGLPEEQEPRVVPLIPFELPGGIDIREAMDAFLGADSAMGKALTAPGGALDEQVWNLRAVRAAEVPAANGVTDARSVARMYASMIGETDGIRLLGQDQLKRATTQLTRGPNAVLFDLDIQFGLGFMVPSELIALGGPGSFGHFGAGGSVGWADPDAGLAVGYVMNRMDIGLAGDVRSTSLFNAAYEAATRS